MAYVIGEIAKIVFLVLGVYCYFVGRSGIKQAKEINSNGIVIVSMLLRGIGLGFFIVGLLFIFM